MPGVILDFCLCVHTLTCAGVYGGLKYVFRRHFTLFPETDSQPPELGLGLDWLALGS